MEYLAIAVVFGLLFGFISFLDEKRKDARREINNIYDILSRHSSQLSTVEGDVREMRGTVRAFDKQEQRVLDGMNSILNYDISQALKAAQGVKTEDADEE